MKTSKRVAFGLIALLLVVWQVGFGQVYQHDFGTTSISCPYNVVPTTLDANLSNSSWTATPDCKSFAGSSGQALSTEGGDGSFTLTFDVNTGCTLDVTSFSFWRRRSGTGPQNWSLTINGTSVGAGSTPSSGANTGTINVSTPITGLSGTITVVLTTTGSSGAGTMRLDDFTLFGSTSCSSTPTVEFSATSSSVPEGDSGSSTHDVSITMNIAPSSDATVDIISVEDSATEDDDYDGVSTSVTFTTGESYPATKIVSVTINGDTDVESDETFNLLLSLAVGSIGLANVGDDQHTVTITNDDFAPITCPAGTETQSQGFEGSGTWSYAVSGNSQSLPCSSAEDFIGEGTTVGTGGDAISASGGAQFFAVRDIQGDCAGSSGIDLNFNTFSATAMTAGNYAISFDYNVFEWDNGDNISYDIQVNSSSVSSGDAVAGSSNFSTTGWETQTVNVTLLAGDDLDFVITLDQNGDGDWGGIDNVILCFISALPVNLTSFKAAETNRNISLTWQTATEQNNSHFLIQRSADGRVFENIGRVEGAGDSDQSIDYSFVDDKPLAGINYYRLHQFDFDGTNEVFGPIAVRFGADGGKPRLWPVPATDRLQVYLPTTDLSWNLEVFSADGQLLRQQKVEDKNTQAFFDVSALPAGVYFMRWANGHEMGQQRFVKQ